MNDSPVYYVQIALLGMLAALGFSMIIVAIYYAMKNRGKK